METSQLDCTLMPTFTVMNMYNRRGIDMPIENPTIRTFIIKTARKINNIETKKI